VANAPPPAEAIAMPGPPDSESQAAAATHRRLNRNAIEPTTHAVRRLGVLEQEFMAVHFYS